MRRNLNVMHRAMEHAEIHEMERVSERFHQHARFPMYLGTIQDAQGKARGVGSCGDAIEISVRLKDDAISAISHKPEGCAYTVACASALCALAKGLSVDDALSLSPGDVARELNGLPEDHLHCARLAVNTLGEALSEAYKACHTNQQKGSVSNADF